MVFENSRVTCPSHSGSNGVTFTIIPHLAYVYLPRNRVKTERGILKYSIPEFLKNNQDLMKIISNISQATTKDGGSGAFYIFLKKNTI